MMAATALIVCFWSRSENRISRNPEFDNTPSKRGDIRSNALLAYLIFLGEGYCNLRLCLANAEHCPHLSGHRVQL
jgi:hypothetical protein